MYFVVVIVVGGGVAFVIVVVVVVSYSLFFLLPTGNPAHAGATFEGSEFKHVCETNFHAKNIRIDIVGEKRYSDFPAISMLEVKLTLDDREVRQ